MSTPIRSHFMHQGHALLQNLNTAEYFCGGCKTYGDGMNFGCQPCNFYMHDFCSNCPTILPSFLHPEHPLSLMISNPASPRICDVCEDSVEGLFYWCQTCNFNVHPLCTKFPPSLLHTVHNQHRLMFQKSYRDAPCCVCGAVCNSWRYRCGYCDGFDVHVDCVTKSYDAKSPDTTTCRRLPPWAGTPPTANSYNNHQITPPYGGVYSMHSPYGIVSHGTYAHQPNFYGEMPVGTNSHNINSYNMCNPFNGLPCNTNPSSMYNPHNGVPFDSNSQHVQIHHSDTSHQAPAHYAHSTSPPQGHGFGKLGRKVFGIVCTLTLGVISNVIFGAL